MKGLIELQGISVSFRDTSALKGVSLEVPESGFMGIVGPSGAGKTTLLKVLAGAFAPSDGEVIRRSGIGIGYVPQVDSIRWDFPVTALEVLLMASRSERLRIWGSRSDRARAIDLLDQLGLAEATHRHIRALSGGQQQRVFIARALMGDPGLLLLDEPTSDVDVATRHDILHLLHDLNHSRSIAVVITTHDLNGIASHMHQLVCLNHTVIAAGPPKEVMTPQILEATYGAPMDVLSHGGMPLAVEPADLEERFNTAHHEH